MDIPPSSPVSSDEPAWRALLQELRTGITVLSAHAQLARRRVERGGPADAAGADRHAAALEACAVRLQLAIEALSDGSWRTWHGRPPPRR